MIKSLEQQLKDVRYPSTEIGSNKINRIYKKRTQSMIEWVKHEMFFDDDSLSLFLHALMENVNQQDGLKHPIKSILVSRDPTVNAYCLGEGTIVVNVGLLSRIRHESQLAYVLCHEMAHLELEHIEHNIDYYINESEFEEVRKNYSTLILGDISLEQASDLKNWANSWGRHARDSEFAADSLGYRFFSNTSYHREGVFETFDLLDSAQYPMYTLGSRLFADLTFSKYPFQEKWLMPRLGLYSQYPTSYLFDQDSIISHPEIELRKEKVSEFFQANDVGTWNLQSGELVNWVINTARFETISGAYQFKRYDACLYQALQLKALYPDNRYVTGMIGKVLIDLLKLRKDTPELFEFYVGKYTIDYSDELRLVNDFLHNITKKELGDIAFHFMNNQSNFDGSDQYHYYLLWQICDLTSREQVKEKVRESYIENFRSAEYCKEMKCVQDHYRYYSPQDVKN